MRVSRTPIKPELRPAPPNTRADAPSPVPLTAAVSSRADDDDVEIEFQQTPPSFLLRPVVLATLIVGALIVAGYLIARQTLPADTPHVASVPTAPVPLAIPITAPDTPKPRQERPRSGTTRAFALWKEKVWSPFDPPTETTAPFQSMIPVLPGFLIPDGTTLLSDERRIHLAGIMSPPRDAVCVSDENLKLACGLMARAALSIVSHSGPLTCYPDVSLETATPDYLCYARGTNLSLKQIETGFALPTTPSLPYVAQLAATARDKHVGAWNGGWTVIPPQGPKP